MPKSVLPRDGAGAPQPRGQSTGTGQYDLRDFQGSKSQKSVLPRARGPEARTGTREYDFETFKAQNAEICTPPRPCPPAPAWTKERPEHGRGGVRFSRLSGLKNAEICTPPRRRRCPPAQRPEHGHGAVRFERLSRLKKPKSVLPRARGPQPPWTPCKFGKTFTSCHPHLRWSHTALVSGKSDDETACCSPIPQTFEALVRLPHNLFDVLAALLWQPHELVDVLGAFLWFQPSLSPMTPNPPGAQG